MTPSSALGRTLGLLVVLVLLGGCGVLGGDERSDTPAKVVDERGMRTDLAPLITRFPQIGDPVAARWQSGTLGQDRSAPGPSTYWIDAVVELDAQVADRLRLEAGPPTGARPDLTPDVDVEIPDGRLAPLTGLAPGRGYEEWAVDSWIVEGTDTLVLTARGQ